MIFSLHRHQTVRAIYCHNDNLSHMQPSSLDEPLYMEATPQTKGHKSPACRGKRCITYGHWTVTSLVEVREHGFLGSSVGGAPEA